MSALRYFTVNTWGTITDPDFEAPQTWGDVFPQVDPAGIRSWKDVLDEVDRCSPLVSRFQMLAFREADRLANLWPMQSSPVASQILSALEADPDDGWRTWVEMEGDKGVARFQAEIAQWRQKPADALQVGSLALNQVAQAHAKAFFEQIDGDTLDALGVVIAEGDHPGSSYHAAELRGSLEVANERAAERGLPFRFMPAGGA